MLKAGDTARLVVPVIQGTVKERRFTADDQIEYLLEWVENGATITRWFTEGQIELVNPQGGA